MVDDTVREEQNIWQTFLKHSEDYEKALGLSSNDLDVIGQGVQERMSMFPDVAETGAKGFLKLTVQDEEFSLAVKHVCGGQYGGDWQDYVVAVCMTNDFLNQSVGYGTTLINIVPDEWHEQILHHLKNGKEETKGSAMLHTLH